MGFKVYGLLEVFLLSLIPTFEGRYAIVYGIGKGYSLSGTLIMASLCLLYTSDAADDGESVDLGGRRIIKK